ncbi:MAG: GNAT family N-acetyltransferase [Pseudomonadota bacterium]
MLRTARNLPLGGFNCFETCDVDEARDIVARNFCSHRLERMSAGDRFNACQNRVDGKRLSLNYIRYGADVTIEPGELSDFYLIQIPITGTAYVQNGTRSVWSTRSMGVVLNPDRNTTMRWHAGCEQVLVQIERSYMAEVATRMTGIGLEAIRFQPGLDMSREPVALWTRRLRGLFGAAETGRTFRDPDMDLIDLAFADPPLRDGIVALNAENVVATSPLDRGRLDWILSHASFSRARSDGRAFVICYGPGATYDSANYAWFSDRYEDFLYVDRIVVGDELRGAGVGRALYGAVLAQAQAQAQGVPVLCEINLDPPNPGSDAFHAALGFTEVGRAETTPGKRVRFMHRAARPHPAI